MIGSTYLVFIDKDNVESGSANTNPRPDFLLGYRSEQCAKSSTSNTVASLSDDLDEVAIFELRFLARDGIRERVAFYVGPSPSISLLPYHVESFTLYVDYPEFTDFQGAISAEDLLQELRNRVD